MNVSSVSMKVLVVLGLFGLAAGASADDYFYRPDWDGGSGTFSDGTRYYGGVVPDKAGKTDANLFFDPTYNKDVRAQPISVTLSAADITYLDEHVTRIQPRNGTVSLTLDTGAEDVTWSGQIYGGGNDVRIVKTGTGEFVMTKTSGAGLSYSGWLIVSNGLFAISAPNNNYTSKAWPMLEVRKPGTLRLASQCHMFAQGLCGDGTVEASDTGKQLVLAGDRNDGDTAPYVFSGTFSTVIPVTLGQQVVDWKTTAPGGRKGEQHFTRHVSKLSMEMRLYSGWIGAEIFDDATDGASIGKTERFNVFGADFAGATVGIRNLGTVPQTTAREIRLFNNNAKLDGFNVHVDGGAYGGLTLAGGISNMAGTALPTQGFENRVTPFYLEGSNPEACVVGCDVTEACPTNHLWFVKRGSGVWRFGDGKDRQFKTPVSVERGTLEYASIAEKGANCSLGLATCLSTNWTGLATEKVSSAILLGDGTAASANDVATFKYVGDGAATCATRPIGVIGAGRVLAKDGSRMDWSGLTAASDAATVVLDGAAEDNVLRNIEDGAGVLAVEKRGAGTWTLDEDVDISGGISVKEGTLKLSLDHSYTWYKFTVLENWGDARSMFTQFALWDAAGNYLNTNLTWNTAADGNLSALKPGEVAFGKSGITCFKNGDDYRSLNKMFDLTSDITDIYAKPVLGQPTTKLDIVMRLPEGKSKAVKYDIYAGNGSTVDGQRYARDARSWSVSASYDGLHWKDISTVISNVPVTKTKSWYSDGTTDKASASAPKGFELTETEQAFARPSSVAFVQVDGGATLVSDAEVKTPRLVYDVAKGGGTLKGFAFDETGTLDIVNATETGAQKLSIDLSGAQDLDNLRNWSVRINGKTKNRTVVPSADGLTILSPGMILIFR